MEHLNENLNETKRGENKSNEQKSALYNIGTLLNLCMIFSSMKSKVKHASFHKKRLKVLIL